MLKVETAHWRRINKVQARKLYNNGEDILVVPHLVHPENMWGIGVITSNAYWNDERDFDKFLNAFIWYNCQYAELGKYPAFYQRKEGK